MTLNLILDVKDNHLFNQIMISMWKRIILKESKNKYIERGWNETVNGSNV